MRNSYKLSYILGIIVFSIVFFPREIYGKESKTTSDIDFMENSDITNPVDPSDPSKPIIPTKPPTSGPLSLNFVSDFDFGTQPMSKENQIYYAVLTEVIHETTSMKQTVPNFVQMTDNRGSLAGWRLYVKQETPLQNEDGFALTGTKLTFSNVTVTSLEQSTAFPTGIPVGPVEIGSDDSGKNIALIAEAYQGTGYGSWSINFGHDLTEGEISVALHVPGDTEKKAGIYSTTLTWLLEDSV